MLRHPRFLFVLVLSCLLAACPAPRRSQPPGQAEDPSLQPVAGASVFDVVPEDSLLRVVVYRAGALAQAGHNHVIASRDLTGKVYLHPDVKHSAFELALPVQTFTVDEPQLRREEGADFPADVSDSARQGTRKNMLGEAVLDSARYPVIRIVSTRITGAGEQLSARVRVGIKGQWYPLTIPLRLRTQDEGLLASGELKLTHRQLGLQPFTALLGALRVQDEMKVNIAVVAHRS